MGTPPSPNPDALNPDASNPDAGAPGADQRLIRTSPSHGPNHSNPGQDRSRPRYRSIRWPVLNGIALLMAVGILIALPRTWWAIALGAVVVLHQAIFVAGMFKPSLGLFANWRCHGPRSRPRFALTFDDGPDPRATPALLDLLAQRQVRATFFCIGQRARNHPAIMQRLRDEGHVIANHSHRHRWWTNFLCGRRLRYELQRAQRDIRQSAGVTPTCWRAPVGLSNPHTGRVSDQLALNLIGWDVRSFDRSWWPGKNKPMLQGHATCPMAPGQGSGSARQTQAARQDHSDATRTIARRVMRQLRPGSIVLLHDGGAEPDRLGDMVRWILDEAASRGLEAVGLDDLLESDLGRPGHRGAKA